MAEGRRRDDWWCMSELMSLIANCKRDPKKRSTPFRPRDFDPYAKRRKPPKVSITVLKDVFIDGKLPPRQGD